MRSTMPAFRNVISSSDQEAIQKLDLLPTVSTRKKPTTSSRPKTFMR
jgi:hypothetical protein